MQDLADFPTQKPESSEVLRATSAEGACAPRRGVALPLSLQQRFLSISAILTTVYLCVIFLGLPLVFTNFYFNITETKQFYFLIASGVYLLLLLFARIALPPDFGVTRQRDLPHPTALLLAAFFVVSLVGGILSRYPGEILVGENNR